MEILCAATGIRRYRPKLSVVSYPWGPQMDTPNPQLRWTSRKTVGLIVVVLGIVIAPIALVMVLTVLRDLSLPSPITRTVPQSSAPGPTPTARR